MIWTLEVEIHYTSFKGFKLYFRSPYELKYFLAYLLSVTKDLTDISIELCSFPMNEYGLNDDDRPEFVDLSDDLMCYIPSDYWKFTEMYGYEIWDRQHPKEERNGTEEI